MQSTKTLSAHEMISIQLQVRAFSEELFGSEMEFETRAMARIEADGTIEHWPMAEPTRRGTKVEAELSNPTAVPPKPGEPLHAFWTRAYLATRLKQQGSTAV